jgi:arylsulfatase A-like enzyme
MNAICLVIDRLHAGHVGAYGNAWIETPALDRLACEAFTFDQALIGSPRTEGLYQAIWQGRHGLLRRPEPPDTPTLPEALAGAGVATTLITDEPAVADHPLAEQFGELIELALPDRVEVAHDVGSTHLAECFAQTIDWLASAREPFLLWTHLTGMAARWDAPYAFRLRYAEQDDPPPPETAEVPRFMLEEDYDPDLLLGIEQSYAGQVTLLDVCVGALVELLRESDWGRETLLVLLSARGFPLGEHRRVGACDEALYGELAQTPMMIRLPDGCGAARRSQALVTAADLGPTLLDWWSIASRRPATFGKSLMPILRGESPTVRDRLLLGSLGAETAIRTPAWYMRLTDPPELFVKPDDRWEVNDVADRCRDVADRLRDAAAAYDEHLQADRLDELEPLDEVLATGLD